MSQENEKLNEIIEKMSHPGTMDVGSEHKDFLVKDGVNAIVNNELALLGAVFKHPKILTIFSSLGEQISDCERQFMKNGGLARIDSKQAISNRWAGQHTEPVTILEKIQGKKDGK